MNLEMVKMNEKKEEILGCFQSLSIREANEAKLEEQ